MIAKVNGLRQGADLTPGDVLLVPPLGLSQRLGQATRDRNGYSANPD